MRNNVQSRGIGAALAASLAFALCSGFGCATGGEAVGTTRDAAPVDSKVAIDPPPADAAPDDDFPTFDADPVDFGFGGDGSEVAIPAGAKPAQISLGQSHTCARLVDGTVRCWGSNSAGELGDGTDVARFVPTPVLGATGIAEVATAVDGRQSCARDASGNITCWGAVDDPSLPLCRYGDPTSWGPCTRTPIRRATMMGVVQLSVGDLDCVRFADGRAHCLESGPTGVLEDLRDIAEIGFGDRHGCARLLDGTLQCWGDDSFGQLGITPTTKCNGPLGTNPCSTTRLVVPVTSVAQIALGDAHTCALISDGTVECWGANDAGQLGYGAVDNCTGYGYPCGLRPRPVPGVTDAVQIDAGGYHTCVLLRDGRVQCWGENSEGELGYPTLSEKCGGEAAFPCSTVATIVPGLSGVAQIALGRRHTCALLLDGTLQCWGWNGHGQLGDGTTVNRPHPTPVKL